MTTALKTRSVETLRADRLIEVLAVILLRIATVGSACCGYQSSKWNGKESDAARAASDSRVEASRLFTLAAQGVTYDATMVANYAQAFQEQNTSLMTFYRTSLIRPAFLPVLDQWEAAVRAGRAPTNLLSDQAYLDTQFGPYRVEEAKAEQNTLAAQDAGVNSDDFVLTTLLFAVALFFAGVTSTFRFRSARIVLLMGAVVAIALAAARLMDVPLA